MRIFRSSHREPSLFFVAINQFAAARRRRNSRLMERDAAVVALLNARAERDATIAELKSAVKERDRLTERLNRASVEKQLAASQQLQSFEERNRALAECDRIFAEHAATLLERDNALAERDRVKVKHSTALTELDEAIAERDRAFVERDHANGERDIAFTIRDKAIWERQAALQDLAKANAERDATFTLRDKAISEHQATLQTLFKATAERDTALQHVEKFDSAYHALAIKYSGLPEEVQSLLGRIELLAANRDCRFTRPYYYLGDNRALTHLSTGHPFFVPTKDCSITPWILMGGHWETFADNIIANYIRPGMKIIDVGANMGYYTVKWASMVGAAGEIHSFEPNPDVLPFLKENVNINGLKPWCHIYELAAGAEAGSAQLSFGYSNMGKSGFYLDIEADRTHEVKIEAIDYLLPSSENIDFMKIDTEGFEPEVLRGASRLISRSPNCAFHIEIQPSWDKFGTIPSILEPLLKGRRIFVIRHNMTLMPIGVDELAGYVDSSYHKMADIFICPDQSELLGRVAQFLTPQELESTM